MFSHLFFGSHDPEPLSPSLPTLDFTCIRHPLHVSTRFVQGRACTEAFPPLLHLDSFSFSSRDREALSPAEFLCGFIFLGENSKFFTAAREAFSFGPVSATRTTIEQSMRKPSEFNKALCLKPSLQVTYVFYAQLSWLRWLFKQRLGHGGKRLQKSGEVRTRAEKCTSS